MKPSVYIETSFVSYLTSRPSRDVVAAGRQQSSHDWWDHERSRYDLFTSALAVVEASAGDPTAAAARVAVLDTLADLAVTPAAAALADGLIANGAIPAVAARDGLHIAVCALYGVDYLLTWNFAHLANAHLRSKIIEVCRASGFRAPTICTPDELMGGKP